MELGEILFSFKTEPIGRLDGSCYTQDGLFIMASSGHNCKVGKICL